MSKTADGEALKSADGREISYASAFGGIWKLVMDGGSISIVPGLANVHANRYCFVTPWGSTSCKRVSALEHSVLSLCDPQDFAGPEHQKETYLLHAKLFGRARRPLAHLLST